MPNVRCDGQQIVATGGMDLARLNIGLAADHGVLISGNATAKDVIKFVAMSAVIVAPTSCNVEARHKGCSLR